MCRHSLLLKTGDNETSVRCLRCFGTAIHLSLINVISRTVPDSESKTAYELSSSGPLVEYLSRHFAGLTTSEYFDNLPPGKSIHGIRCEDVQNLSFPDSSFDICTSTEVFEHVADDHAGFKEIRRVLKGSGYFIFTVPLHNSDKTMERAYQDDSKIIHILPASYHSDKIRGTGNVLVYRDYGNDITERLVDAGFSQTYITEPTQTFFAYSRKVVVAKT